MRYKTGDKVVIRDDLIEGKEYGGLIVEEIMLINLGGVVEISQIYRGVSTDFYILTDGTKFYTDEMINHEETKLLQKGECRDMKLSDLKSGHVVKLRNGDDYIVMRNEFGGKDYLFNPIWQTIIDEKSFEDEDVVEVYEPSYEYSLKTLYSNLDNKDYFKLVWKREERQRMTVTEIEDKLGYKIEIVGEGWILSNEE